jgi:hypothetical protein
LEASKKLANRSPSTNPEANQVAIGRGIEIASAEAEQLAAMFSGNSSPATSAPIVEAHMMPAAISALTAQTISKAEGLAASLRVICGGSSCSGAVKR